MDFPELTEAKVLTIKPGDVVVLRSDRELSDRQVTSIRDQLSGLFNCPIVILERMALDIVHEEATA